MKHKKGTNYRNIQPINVAKRWALCSHLESAVICLAQAGHPTGTDETQLKYLKKAASYVERELTIDPPCPFVPIGAQPFTLETVLEEWNVPFHVGEALFFIKASKSPSLKQESLNQALMHLKAQIALWKPLEPSHQPSTGGNTPCKP